MIVFNSENLKEQSLNDLTILVGKKSGIDISKQSLHDRFNKYAVSFLKETLEKILNKQICVEPLIKDVEKFNRILIKDSVCFQIDESLSEYYPGSGGNGSSASVRIQFEYDLLCGRINDLSVNAFNSQDAKDSIATIELTKQDDLIIRDLAYMGLEALELIAKNLAFFLCRLSPTVNVYEIKKGEYLKINFKKIYNYLKKKNLSVMERRVYLGKQAKLEVRLIIHLLPQDEYEKRIRKAKKNNKKKNRGGLSKEYKARAALNMFISNADENLIPTANVWPLYRLRWQIELIFKVWKSICDIEKVKKVKKHRLECYIYSKLIFITLGWQILWNIAQQMLTQEGKALSFYKAFKTLLCAINELREIIIFKIKELKYFMVEFYQISRTKHLLEKKKQTPTSIEFLINCLGKKSVENQIDGV